MSAQFRLGVGQPPAHLTARQERLDWLRTALQQAAGQHADMLLLPELFASGYNVGPLMRARAEPSDGATARTIAGLAHEFDIAIHYGYAERAQDQIYNSAQCIGPDGLMLGHHRKLIIPPGFETDIFSRGKTCDLFTYRSVTFATLICYDAEFPETARYVAAKGAEVILAPTALGDQWSWVAHRMIPTRGYENGVFLAYANSAGCENGMSFLGQSFIAAPDGRELIRAGPDPEIIVATLDLDLVSKAQARLPYLRDRLSFDLT